MLYENLFLTNPYLFLTNPVGFFVSELSHWIIERYLFGVDI